MKTVWDVLKYIRKTQKIGIREACLIIREGNFGDHYELTEKGITEYFIHQGNLEFKLSGVKENGDSFNVVLQLRNKVTGEISVGCAVADKTDTPEEDFSYAVNRALLNGMRSLLSHELEFFLIDKYIREKRFVRIPRETEKVKIFKPKNDFVFAHQAG